MTQISINVVTESVDPKNDLTCIKTITPYTLTTEHAASSDGVPVLVSPDGVVYRADDVLPNNGTAWITVHQSREADISKEARILADKFASSHSEPEVDPFEHLFISSE